MRLILLRDIRHQLHRDYFLSSSVTSHTSHTFKLNELPTLSHDSFLIHHHDHQYFHSFHLTKLCVQMMHNKNSTTPLKFASLANTHMWHCKAWLLLSKSPTRRTSCLRKTKYFRVLVYRIVRIFPIFFIYSESWIHLYVPGNQWMACLAVRWWASNIL